MLRAGLSDFLENPPTSAALLCDTDFVMPIADLKEAAEKVAGFLNSLNKLGGMRLKYRISAGDGAPASGDARQLNVELAGPDVPLVIQHNGELLRALETIAGQILRLDPREGDAVSFDAGNFKALREQELKLAAETAAEKVLRTGVPYSFPPMNSRERRTLHMICKELEGVESASVGEGRDRFLVVYPEGKTDIPVAAPVQSRGPSRGPMKPRGFGRR
jgi:spoIIIJ-associated protein